MEVQISRPRDEVSVYVIDPTHDPEWINGIKEPVPIITGSTAVGSKARRVASFMGRRIEYTPEVTELIARQHSSLQNQTPEEFLRFPTQRNDPVGLSQ